jgi:hypothetical protein
LNLLSLVEVDDSLKFVAPIKTSSLASQLPQGSLAHTKSCKTQNLWELACQR